jgi:hypothetical protein
VKKTKTKNPPKPKVVRKPARVARAASVDAVLHAGLRVNEGLGLVAGAINRAFALHDLATDGPGAFQLLYNGQLRIAEAIEGLASAITSRQLLVGYEGPVGLKVSGPSTAEPAAGDDDDDGVMSGTYESVAAERDESEEGVHE